MGGGGGFRLMKGVYIIGYIMGGGGIMLKWGVE